MSLRRRATSPARFTHAGGPCPTGVAETMRRLAVQSLWERRALFLPPLSIFAFVGDERVEVSRPVAREQAFDDVFPGLPCGSLVPDAVAMLGNRRLAVSFRTLMSSTDGPALAREAGVALLEIDVRDAAAVPPESVAEWMLLSAPRRWSWHPWLPAMEAEASALAAARG